MGIPSGQQAQSSSSSSDAQYDSSSDEDVDDPDLKRLYRGRGNDGETNNDNSNNAAAAAAARSSKPSCALADNPRFRTPYWSPTSNTGTSDIVFNAAANAIKSLIGYSSVGRDGAPFSSFGEFDSILPGKQILPSGSRTSVKAAQLEFRSIAALVACLFIQTERYFTPGAPVFESKGRPCPMIAVPDDNDLTFNPLHGRGHCWFQVRNTAGSRPRPFGVLAADLNAADNSSYPRTSTAWSAVPQEQLGDPAKPSSVQTFHLMALFFAGMNAIGVPGFPKLAYTYEDLLKSDWGGPDGERNFVTHACGNKGCVRFFFFFFSN